MTAAEATQPRSKLRHLVWVPQALLALGMLFAGLAKLFGESSMVTLFDDIGAGQWLRYVVGLLEVSGAIGLLVPRLAALAALGLVGVMAGAAFTNVVVLDTSPFLPLFYVLLAATVAWFRRPNRP